MPRLDAGDRGAPPEPEQGSPMALGGLLFGIGVLDAEEVMRYLDATFRRRAMEEKVDGKGNTHE